MAQSSLPTPQSEDREAGEKGLLYPRPRREVLEPGEGREILRQIIKNFMSKHNVYEVRRLWLLHRYYTRFIQLKGDVDLHINSHMKYLIMPDKDHIETIILTARKGKKILDEVMVHIDISLEESRTIEDVWDSIEWDHIIENKHFCLEDHVEFDSDVDNLHGIEVVDRPGYEIYSRQACHVLAQHGLDEDEEEE